MTRPVLAWSKRANLPRLGLCVARAARSRRRAELLVVLASPEDYLSTDRVPKVRLKTVTVHPLTTLVLPDKHLYNSIVAIGPYEMWDHPSMLRLKHPNKALSGGNDRDFPVESPSFSPVFKTLESEAAPIVLEGFQRQKWGVPCRDSEQEACRQCSLEAVKPARVLKPFPAYLWQPGFIARGHQTFFGHMDRHA